MSLSQHLRAATVPHAEVLGHARKLAEKIRTVSKPERIVLFGSGAEGRFRDGSDLDLLLVFSDQESLKAGRTAVRSLRPLSTFCPVDLVFVTVQVYEAKKDVGGICFIAAHDGVAL